MARYVGVKPLTHDSSLFVIDTDKQALFGLSVERVTRMKRDAGHISLISDYLKEFDHIYLSFAYGSELQSLRDMIPLALGLTEHPVRDIIRNHLLSDEEKLAQIAKLHPSMLQVVKGWFEIQAMIKADTTKYQKIADDAWIQANKQRLPWVKQFSGFDHHTCHAASAYYHCDFDDCAVVTLDSLGNNCFSKVFHGHDGRLKEIVASECRWTWGWLYANVTMVLGYFHNADEGKVEALAAFAEPDEKLYHSLMQGYTISQDMQIIGNEHHLAQHWTQSALQHYRDHLGREVLAATVQKFLEDKAVEYMIKIRENVGSRAACAGGIFANVKMNQAIFERAGFDEIYITPAMNDSGSAQGAAYLAAKEAGEDLSWVREHKMPFWGPSYTEEEVLFALNAASDKIRFEKITDGAKRIAQALYQNHIVALFHGKQEWGPRALGHRSILANATGGEIIKNQINTAIKQREEFQPFCPSMLAEERERVFVSAYHNLHMTSAFQLKDEHFKRLEAIAHIDKTARPQFVTAKEAPFFHNVLTEIKQLTGYGVVLNTSFNLHGRAMVLTPEDAITDFLDCNIDALYLQGYWVSYS